MDDQDAINEQLTLLSTYRATLAIYIRQRAAFGFAHTPPVVITSIVECREQIRRIKAYLRSLQVSVEDLPDDEEYAAGRSRSSAYANVPQLSYFVGRDEELEWLKQNLSPSKRTWLFLITGIGGVGKTALAQAIGAYYRDQYAALDPGERFEAIIWVSAKEDRLTVQGSQQIGLPGLTSLFNEFREILSYAIEAAKKVDDLNREGFFSYWMGWLAPLQGEREKGRRYLARAEEIALQEHNDRLLADVSYMRANELLNKSPLTPEASAEAELLLQKSLAISTEQHFPQVQSLAASRLGQIVGERGAFDQALDLLQIAERAAGEIGWQRGLAWAKYRRGCVKLAMRSLAEAKSLFNESLRIIEPWDERYLIGDNKYLLAQVYAAEGDAVSARAMAQAAYNIFDRLGVNKKKRRVQALIASLDG